MAFWRPILNRIIGGIKAQGVPAPDDDYWYNPLLGSTASGARVTPDNALALPAVFACHRVIIETVASLPLLMYRWRSDGGKERAGDHPLYDVLHDRPNPWQTSFEFREMMQGHLELRGNAYAQIVPGRRGAVDQLIPLHPDRVTPCRVGNRIIYKVNWNDGTSSDLLQEEVFHLRGFSQDGLVGLSPIALEREAVGLGLTAQEYGSRFFANDATPGGIIKHPTHFENKEDDERFRASWQRAQSGRNQHKVAVLEDGLSYEKIGLTNRDAQFLETRKYNAEDIARIFRVPPHKIGILDRATFSNIEQQNIQFATDCAVPRLRRWEQRISFDLILEPQTYFAEFLLDGLYRGDIKTRYEAYHLARLDGWMNGNEIRAFESMNPFDGGEVYWAPVNMVPAEQLGAAPVAPPAMEAPPRGAAAAQVGMIVDAAVERVSRREVGSLRKALARAECAEVFGCEAELFYAKHRDFMLSVLPAAPILVDGFVALHLAQLRAYAAGDNWKVGAETLLNKWESEGGANMKDLLLGDQYAR